MARRPQGVGLLLLDLDGTIIRGGVEVSPRVAEALRRAHEAGIYLAVSTGRPLQMVPKAVKRLGVMDFYLCSNGAKAYDGSYGELCSHTMAHSDVRRLMDVFELLEPGWNVMSNGHAWIERSSISYLLGDARVVRSRLRSRFPRNPREAVSFVRWAKNVMFGNPGRSVVRSIAPIVEENETFEKLGCSFAKEELCDEAVRRLEELGGFTAARVLPLELEITSQGVNKGALADWLLDRLEMGRECSVAFGDSMNDAPLIGHVGRFVAMGNACDELKGYADETCESLADDGVARWIERVLDEA